MSLLGRAAVAMWWTIDPASRAEFGDWHTHEHFPERMSIRGFNRGSRWTSLDTADGFFVLYELEEYETLSSQPYLERLNAPTAQSQKMMPLHCGMVRSQCRILASYGAGTGAFLATMRFAPTQGQRRKLGPELTGALAELAILPGLSGAHLLLTDTPPSQSPTTEQRIRGADQQADWIVLINGYEREAVEHAVRMRLPLERQSTAPTDSAPMIDCFSLAMSITPADVAKGVPSPTT